MALLQTPSRLGRGKHLPILHPLDAFRVSARRLWSLRLRRYPAHFFTAGDAPAGSLIIIARGGVNLKAAIWVWPNNK